MIAYRDELPLRCLQGATIRRKLAALSSVYEYLCDQNTAPMNPVKSVARPKLDSYDGETPARSDAQVRALLNAPQGQTLKAKRDRAILSNLCSHALRRQELCRLRIKVHATPARRDELFKQLDSTQQVARADRLRSRIGLNLGRAGPEILALSIAAALQQFLVMRR